MAKRGGFPGGGIPGNMNNLMKQAQKMQRQMKVLLRCIIPPAAKLLCFCLHLCQLCFGFLLQFNRNKCTQAYPPPFLKKSSAQPYLAGLHRAFSFLKILLFYQCQRLLYYVFYRKAKVLEQ